MLGDGGVCVSGGGNPWQFDKPYLVMTLGDCVLTQRVVCVRLHADVYSLPFSLSLPCLSLYLSYHLFASLPSLPPSQPVR